jgi:putative membrane protein
VKNKGFILGAAFTLGLATAACEMPMDAGGGDRMSDQAAAARDQTPAGTTQQMDTGEARQFIQQAASGNLAEVELGQLASQRAQSNDVRQFGQRMVQDHSKALDQLRSAASSANVSVPTTMSQEHQNIRQRLSSLQGEEFDREYISVMVDEHQKMVNMLEERRDAAGMQPGAASPSNAQQGGGMAPLNSWASQTLPIVQEHLEQARQIQQRLR